MRSRFLFYIFLFLLSSLAIGCYDGEGNYDYKTINEVAVKLEETYGVRKVDTVFVIRPEIRQSLATDTTNLKFEWYYNSASDQFKGDLVSTADTVAIRIDPADKKFSYNHYLQVLIAFVSAILNLIVDIIYTFIDPRMKTMYESSKGASARAKKKGEQKTA